MTSVHFKSEKMDWATPPEVWALLNAEFGFTLDVCALPENAKVPRYFTPDDNGLEQQWEGVCWMNPPYGREIGAWMRKAKSEASAGRATVVCLVPSRTDTAWWHDNVQGHAEVRFLRGRVRFVGAQHSAPFPSAIVVYRAAQGVTP